MKQTAVPTDQTDEIPCGLVGFFAVCVSVCVHALICAFVCVCVCAYMHVCVCVCACMRACVCACQFACQCVHVYAVLHLHTVSFFFFSSLPWISFGERKNKGKLG